MKWRMFVVEEGEKCQCKLGRKPLNITYDIMAYNVYRIELDWRSRINVSDPTL